MPISFEGLTLNQTTNFWTGPNRNHFADDKINVFEKLKFAFGRLQIVVTKVENTGDLRLLLALILPFATMD